MTVARASIFRTLSKTTLLKRRRLRGFDWTLVATASIFPASDHTFLWLQGKDINRLLSDAVHNKTTFVQSILQTRDIYQCVLCNSALEVQCLPFVVFGCVTNDTKSMRSSVAVTRRGCTSIVGSEMEKFAKSCNTSPYMCLRILMCVPMPHQVSVVPLLCLYV